MICDKHRKYSVLSEGGTGIVCTVCMLEQKIIDAGELQLADEQSIRNAKKRIANLENALTMLRSVLKKLEWCLERSEAPGVGVTHYCPVCGECKEDSQGQHEAYCWLNAEIGPQVLGPEE